MKLLLILVTVVVLVIVGFFVFSSPKRESKNTISPTQTQQETEIKAAFAIFTNGTFRVFIASMYHNLSDDVFIEASNPNTVRVKKEGVTWDDFFKTLPMKLTRDCLTTGMGQTFCTNLNQTLKFYINGVLDSNALVRTINEGDQLLVSLGNESEAQIQNQLQEIPKIK